MQLPNDLIAQFAKLASGSETREPQIKTLYGTITGKGKQVLIDGSSAPTPIMFDDDGSASTVNVKDGDRVLLQVKNHSVVITGNITDPSIGSDTDIQIGTSESGEIETTKITNLGIVMADKIQTEVANVNKLVADEISAVDAEIINLTAKNAEITDTLTATNADVTNLKTSHAEITGNLEAVNADIENLKATDADFRTLESDYATFTETTTDSLKAQVADIEKLKTEKLDAETADIKYAKIVDLNATNANVENLDADVADINTLIFGSASGEVIQTEFANAVIAQLGNAQIKSAMIQNVDVDKLNAGDISTNKMRVVSDDGKLVISDETIQISDNNRVRVQIGKDSSNDYSINIWDESGNLMFSKGGITDKAIKEAIIRNDMVSEDANISASKLNISSLFTEINNSTETIKSTKIYLDDEKQTLDVAFTQMSSDLDGTKETVSSQGTQLSVIQGKIESKVWQQDINDATGDLSTRLSTVEQDIDGITTTVGSHTTQLEDIKNTADQNAEEVNDLIVRVTTAESKIEQNANSITSVANRTTAVENKFGEYSTTEQMNSAIEQKANSITSTVSATYATKNEAVISPKIDGDQTRIVRINNAIADSIENVKLYGKTTQNGTPTPEAPVELVSVGDSGNIGVTVAGKNLLNYEIVASYSGSGVTSTIDENGYITLTNTTASYTQYPQQTITDFKGTLYTTIEVVSITGSVSIYGGNASNDYSSVINSVGTKTFTKEVDGYFRFMAAMGAGSSVKFRAIVSADSNPDYEPYQEPQTLTASTPNCLPGIPVSSGGNYTDENGQQWICDEIDFARGVYVQRVYEYTCTGAEAIVVYGSTNAKGYCRWNVLLGITDTETANFVSLGKAVPSLSNKHTAYTADALAVLINHGGEGYGFSFVSNARVVFSTTSTVLADFTAEITGTKILYQLATPIETALSAEELAAFADLTNEPGTVTVYSEAALEVELSGIASSSAVTDAQKTANEAQGRADEAVVTITEMQTTIQQLSDSIAMLVRDGTGGSMLKQDANGLWYFDISGIEKSISDTANDLGTLDGIVRDANGEIDVLKTTAAALQDRTEYVRSYTDENDQPCLELGEGDSVFKVRITNTEIQFAEGTAVPAKLNRKMLVIEKAMVKDELQFGDDEVVDGVWIWKRRENGNLGLSWKEVVS